MLPKIFLDISKKKNQNKSQFRPQSTGCLQLNGVNLKSMEFHSTQWCELKKCGISFQLNDVNLECMEFHSNSMV